MFKWLTKLFSGTSVPEVINEAMIPAPSTVAAPTTAPTKKKTTKKTATKKTTTKKVQNEALEAMTKTELLEVAKLHSIKANASLKKSELIERIKNG